MGTETEHAVHIRSQLQGGIMLHKYAILLNFSTMTLEAELYQIIKKEVLECCEHTCLVVEKIATSAGSKFSTIAFARCFTASRCSWVAKSGSTRNPASYISF